MPDLTAGALDSIETRILNCRHSRDGFLLPSEALALVKEIRGLASLLVLKDQELKGLYRAIGFALERGRDQDLRNFQTAHRVLNPWVECDPDPSAPASSFPVTVIGR